MIIDPNNHDRQWKDWVAKGMPFKNTTNENREIFVHFLKDMELGLNVSLNGKKGGRGAGRLLNLRSKLQTLGHIVHKELDISDIRKLQGKEREILELMKKAKELKIITDNNHGKPLKSVGTYVKVLKTFWHWYQKVEYKNGKHIDDITIYMDGTDPKPEFNYFTIEHLKALCDNAKFDYKVLMMFLFDTGIRAPKELMNVQVKDLEWLEKENHYSLNIKEESSKTFGRKIKLMLCSDILRQYIKNRKLYPQDYIFTSKPFVVNQYLKNLGFKVLQIGAPKDKVWGKKNQKFVTVTNGLTMYDFRHCSACYWLPRYRTESAIKYRFGWKKSEMIQYYTEFLGMKDTIQHDDLFVDITKTELENKLNAETKEREILQDRLEAQEKSSNEEMIKMKKMIENIRLSVSRQVTTEHCKNKK